jgi:hypothetical protein
MDDEMMDEPAVDGVEVESSPLTAPADGTAEVCWSVAGHGTIPHTAVHVDNESHPDGGTFNDYDLGAYYPDNDDTGSYDLPGAFCTLVMMPSEGTLYLRAHAMVSAPGTVSDEVAILSTPAV